MIFLTWLKLFMFQTISMGTEIPAASGLPSNLALFRCINQQSQRKICGLLRTAHEFLEHFEQGTTFSHGG